MKKTIKGFTLIEVSLALLVSVAVLSGVGYLYNNAAVTNLGVVAANETLSAATLCLAQESGINTGCSPVAESGGQVVTAIAAGTGTLGQVMVVTFGGPLAKSLSGGAGISVNACYVAYAAINNAGFLVVNSGTGTTGSITAISVATACTPVLGVIAGLGIAKKALN